MDLKFEQAEFSLPEAERITGLSTAAIRTWKRRGLLESGGAYSKLRASLVASLLLRKQLVDRGYSPSEARDLGDQFAPDILYFAILETGASCEVRGSRAAVCAFEDRFGDSTDIAAQLSPTVGIPATTLISMDGGSLEAVTIEALHIGPDSVGGYFIHLLGLARHLGAAARKPLFSIAIRTPEDAEERAVVRRVPRTVA